MGDFRQFGPDFLATLFTEAFMQAQVAQSIPRRVYIDKAPFAAGWIEPTIGPLTRALDLCEITFQTTLTLRFHLGTPVGDQTPVATVPLTIRIRTFAPAVLKVLIDKVKADQVTFDGGPWGLIAGELAKQLNQQIAKSEVDRTFDLTRMLLESTATEQPWLTTNAKEAPMVFGKESAVEAQLGPGTSHTYALMLAEGETFRFRLYAQYLEQPGLMDGAGLAWQILDPRGKEYHAAFIPIDSEGWGQEYSLYDDPPGDSWHEAPMTGVYRVRLRSPRSSEIGGGYRLRYLLKQERGSVAHGERICFDQFGVNFMQRAINADLIALQLRRQIPAQITQDDGTIRVEGQIAITQVQPLPAMAESYLLYEASLKLDLKLTVGPCSWQVPASAKMRLRVWTEAPTAIVVKPDQVQEADVSVDMDAVKAIDGSPGLCGLDVVEKAIGSAVRGQLVGTLAKQVEEAGIQRTVIARLRDEMIGLPPKVAQGVRPAKRPSKEPAPLLFSGLTLQGELKPGPGHYYPVTLEKGQTMRIAFTGTWKELDYAGYNQIVSIAVCDDEKGHLAHEWVLPDSDKRTCKGRLSFKAPYDGEFLVRLRFQYGVSDPAEMTYKLECK